MSFDIFGPLKDAGAWFGFTDPKPPNPGNFYSYNADGTLQSEMIWDGNGYSYRAGALSPQEQNLRNNQYALVDQMIKNINLTPEQQLAQYADYTKAFSNALHLNVDRQFNKDVQANNENLAARGLFGSRAFVDTNSQINLNRQLSNADIANKAVLGGYDQVNKARSYWNSVLLGQEGQMNAQRQLDQNQQALAYNGTKLGLDATFGKYNADVGLNNARKQNFQNKIDTGVGIAALYA